MLKMMGKGGEGKCCTEEPCSQLLKSKASVKNAVVDPFVQLGQKMNEHGRRQGMDMYSQVLKCLAVKPAFKVDEAGQGGLFPLSSATSSVRGFGSTENKRKHRPKQTQLLGSTNRKCTPYNWGGDSSGQFWSQMEGYFRDVMSEDIQLLLPVTNLSFSNDLHSIDSSFLMPAVSHFHRKTWFAENLYDDEKDSNGVSESSITRVKRKLLATSPVVKKKKISNSSIDAVTIVISPADNDDGDRCHVCYGGDSDEQNQILFCDSCNLAVHQECYGIPVVPDRQWLCSWCSYRCAIPQSSSATKSTLFESPSEDGGHPEAQLSDCVLCPVKGGAVKPVDENDSNLANRYPEKMRFAHLFCCQWIPETYIHDMAKMEPIKNVEGVREERWTLLCSICRNRRGACIQCSHGMCATAFHPLCAREAKLHMEVSSKVGSDDIELWAFCSKHSASGGKAGAAGNIDADGALEVKKSPLPFDSTLKGNASLFNKEDFHLGEATGKESTCMDKTTIGIISSSAKTSRGEDDHGILFETEDSECLNYGPADNVCSAGKSLEKLMNERDRRGSTLEDSGSIAETCGGHVNGHLSSDIGSGSSPFKDNFMDEAEKSCTTLEAERNTNKNWEFAGVGTQLVNSSCVSADSGSALWKPDNVPKSDGNNPAVQLPSFIQGRDLALDKENLDNTEMVFWNFGNSKPVADGTGLKKFGTAMKTAFFNECTSCDTEIDKSKIASEFPTKALIEGKHELQPMEAVPFSECNQLATLPCEDRQNPSQKGETFVCGKDYSEFIMHPFIMKRLQESQQSWSVDISNYKKPNQLEEVGKEDQAHAWNASRDQQQIIGYKSNEASVPGQELDHCLGSLIPRTGEPMDAQWNQIQKARMLGVLDLWPMDELDAEILGLQNWLISCAHANRYSSEQLILKVITNLPKELRASCRRQQELMLVNHYLDETREVKKQGRKERRHKEAQAVLAAATAAAAASPRLGCARRDRLVTEDMPFPARESLPLAGNSQTSIGPAASLEFPSDTPVSYHGKPPTSKPLKLNITARRPSSSRTVLRAKGTLQKLVDAVLPLNKSHLDHCKELVKESASCHICGIQDSSSSNKILYCHRCKVAVHQDCYGIHRFPVGSWYCQPCFEVHVSQGSSPIDMDCRGKPGIGIQCALCYGHSGAFKKSTDGRWVHVFCAQWIPETTVGPDQTDAIDGLETVPSERFSTLCSVCHRKQAACLRCNFGHCHGAFHPVCAREAGLYMSVKLNSVGQPQYRAYCEKHSPQQREKAKSWRFGGSDELNALKQIRIELERVRLICERISRRERLKRDLLNCMRDLYATRMDAIAFSAMFRASHCQPATHCLMDVATSLQQTHNKENPWCTDDLPKDSMVGKPHQSDVESYFWQGGATEVHCYPQSKCGDHGNQNQLGSQHPELVGQLSADRHTGPTSIGLYNMGKEVDTMDGDAIKEEEQKRLRKIRKQVETLHREVVMTPTEASVQNQRLPKGYAYVPVVLLSKGKVAPPELSQDT